MAYNYEDNTKLRIVLLLDDLTNQTITNINQEINLGLSHEIEFSNNCIPHITLFSGKLKHSSDFELVSKIIKEKMKLIFSKKPTISFDEFYFSPDKSWLFLGLEDNQILLNFILELRKSLCDYFDISDARRLHVTIAKSKNLQTKNEVINNLQIPKGFNANSVAIGLSGENGTLVNIIEYYGINLNKSVENNLT